MNESKYTLKLNGTVSDGKYTESFTEKNVDHIEFSFGNKKIKIGDSLESARKLQELVKKKIGALSPNENELEDLVDVRDIVDWHELHLLQSLVKESER